MSNHQSKFTRVITTEKGGGERKTISEPNASIKEMALKFWTSGAMHNALLHTSANVNHTQLSAETNLIHAMKSPNLLEISEKENFKNHIVELATQITERELQENQNDTNQRN